MLWNRKSSEFELNCGQPERLPTVFPVRVLPSFYQFCFAVADPVQFLAATVAIILEFPVNGNATPGTEITVGIAVPIVL